MTKNKSPSPILTAALVVVLLIVLGPALVYLAGALLRIWQAAWGWSF